MFRRREGTVVAVCTVLLLAACGEEPSPVQQDAIPQQVVESSHRTTCDLTQSLSQDVGSYFPQPERRDARESMRTLDRACKDGDQAGTRDAAHALLDQMEAVLDAGRGGDVVVGARLANGLLACTVSLCTSLQLPGLNLAPALGPNGLFAIRSTDTKDALARGTIPFTDPSGTPNSAQWGIEVDQSWAVLLGASPVLIYGAPAGENAIPLKDQSLAGLKFDLNRWPDTGPFDDDLLHVGVCFEEEIPLPHGGAHGRSLLERMQREGTLLSAYAPGFCNASPAAFGLANAARGALHALARIVLPQPLRAFVRDDRRAPHVGGSAGDFSIFAAVAADTAGTLEMVSGPNSVVQAGESLGVVRVKAVSGSGTPMERVRVTLAVENNSGEPAGAELFGGTVQYTDEEAGIATFDNVWVDKAGGYIICATAELAGFSYERVCSELFHARN
jgi:hypothetical protein